MRYPLIFELGYVADAADRYAGKVLAIRVAIPAGSSRTGVNFKGFSALPALECYCLLFMFPVSSHRSRVWA